jgi:hypothetical protein
MADSVASVEEVFDENVDPESKRGLQLLAERQAAAARGAGSSTAGSSSTAFFGKRKERIAGPKSPVTAVSERTSPDPFWSLYSSSLASPVLTMR